MPNQSVVKEDRYVRKIVLRFMVASLLLAATFALPQPVAAQGSCPYPFVSGESCVIAGYKCEIIAGTPTAWFLICPGDTIVYSCDAYHGSYWCDCTAEGICG